MSCLPRYGAVMDPIRIRMNTDTFWFERYTHEQEYGEEIKAMVIEFGGTMEEDLLIKMIEEKWQLNDTQGRHRTAKTRIKQAVEAGFITMSQTGVSVVYGAQA